MQTQHSKYLAKLLALAFGLILFSGCCCQFTPPSPSAPYHPNASTDRTELAATPPSIIVSEALITRELEAKNNCTVEFLSITDLGAGHSIISRTTKPIPGTGEFYVEQGHYFRSLTGEYTLISKSGSRSGPQKEFKNTDCIVLPDGCS